MKRPFTLILLLVMVFNLVACGSTHSSEPTPEPLKFSDDPSAIAVASESVVMLNCYDNKGELYCTGSAFQCFEDGIYVTNYHVIEGVDKIQGCTEKKLYFDIDEVIAADPDRDIAILKTSADPGVAVLSDGDSDALIKGENVVAIGSPKGFLNTVSKGTYSGVAEFDDGQKLLQFNASVSSGSSGGALFNDKGEVIGITSSQYTEGDDLNFAVTINDLKEVWENREKYYVDTEDVANGVVMTLTEFNKTYYDYTNERIRLDVYVSSTVMQFDTSNKFSKYSCFVAERIEDVSGMEITTSGTTLYSVPYQKELARYKTEGIRKIDFNEIQDLKPGDHILVEFDNLVLYNSSFPENGTVIKKYEHP